MAGGTDLKDCGHLKCHTLNVIVTEQGADVRHARSDSAVERDLQREFVRHSDLVCDLEDL